jgi:hypothetical protein
LFSKISYLTANDSWFRIPMAFGENFPALGARLKFKHARASLCRLGSPAVRSWSFCSSNQRPGSDRIKRASGVAPCFPAVCLDWPTYLLGFFPRRIRLPITYARKPSWRVKGGCWALMLTPDAGHTLHCSLICEISYLTPPLSQHDPSKASGP